MAISMGKILAMHKPTVGILCSNQIHLIMVYHGYEDHIQAELGEIFASKLWDRHV